MKRILIGLAITTLFFVVGCASSPSQKSSGIPVPAPAPAPMPAPASMPPREGISQDSTLPASDEERMIIRTGDMSILVDDVELSRDKIAQMAVRFDGYVVSSRVSGEEKDKRGSISIRIPDKQFELVLIEIRELAVRVEYENTYSEDVTEQYIDLQSRLRNAEATESQYLAVLEKAVEIEDILRTYDSLSRVRNEIEQIKGRMQYLERTSSMSLLSVQLEPATTTQGLVRVGWSALEVFKTGIRGIVIFGQWLATTAIWLAIFSPVWGAVIAIIYWRRRRKRNQGKAAQ